MTEYKCGSAKSCKYGDMCKPKYDIGGCSHYKEKRTQTNEEWFCTLPTKEKAEVISQLSYYHGNIYEIEMWLKQPHTEKE